jgi:N-acetylgalactosamine kinase
MNNKVINCIILCGGKGSRMNSPTKHKVCFEIDGVPAINRIISNFKDSGIEKITLVVGSMAGHVIECAGSVHEDTSFIYQKTPLGTGDAAKRGLDFIKRMGVSGPVLITMGDKLIEPVTIKALAEKFFEENLDALIAVQPKEYNKSGGRIVFDGKGSIRGICESIDVKSALIYKKLFELLNESVNSSIAVDIDPVIEYSMQNITDTKKRELVLSEINSFIQSSKLNNPGELLTRFKDKQYIKLGSELFEPGYVENTTCVNAAVYLFKHEALHYALDKISVNNV